MEVANPLQLLSKRMLVSICEPLVASPTPAKTSLSA